MSFAFKKFKFFNTTELSGHSWPQNATCNAPSRACMAVGCENGSVQLLDDSFRTLAGFAAHGYRVFELTWLELRGQPLLLSLGSEEPGYSSSTLKLWDVSRLLPQPHSTAAAATPSEPPTAGATHGTSTPAGTAGAGGPAGAEAGGGSAASGMGPGGAGGGAASGLQPLKAFKVFGPKTSEAEVTSMAVKEGLPAVGSALAPPPVSAATSSAATAGGGVAVSAVIALGMANGLVYLYTLEAPAPAAAARSKPQPPVSHHQLPHLPPTKLNARPDPGEDAAVMGLVLMAASGAAGPRITSLFAVTESQTLSFNLGGGTKTILDHHGVRTPYCCVLRSPSQQQQEAADSSHGPGQPRGSAAGVADSLLMVARDEGLYEYTSDTRAGCTVFEGSKQLLLTLGRFVVVVTHEVSGDVGARSATVHILDLKHRLVAGNLTTGSVEAAAAAWGGLLVVSGGGKVMMLKEVDLAVQLDSLFRRSLHKLALDLARAHNADASTIASIQQRWGDALYDKGEFDLAMAAYKETLHHLEPSYVLRRFLDAQRIHNLTSYLELLHDKGLASADHTTLLLNCYTKLKDVAKLDAFIQRSGVPQAAAAASHAALPAHTSPEAGAASRLKFDAETAVKVLRTAGYHRQALWVAQAAGQADWVLDILMEDLTAYDDALALLEKLPRKHRAFTLRRMGQALVTNRPEAATRALMELCCPPPTLDSGSAKQAQNKDADYTASVADFAHLYTHTPTALMLLCEFILNTTASAANAIADPQQTSVANEATLYHTLLELYLMEHLVDQDQVEQQQRQKQEQQQRQRQQQGHDKQKHKEKQQQQQPQQQQEQQQQQQQQQQQHQKQLQQHKALISGASHHQQARRGKALDLMASGWPPHLDNPKYDAHHVLALCRLHNFREGLVFLYDKMRLAREVLQVYMSAGDHAGLISAVSKYGDACRGGDPQLWADVLQHFVEQPGSSCEPQIVEVVGHIEDGGILPPLVVLQLLAKNKSIKMSSIRQYVSRQLAREMSESARDRDAVARLSSETTGLRSELHKLKSEAHVFQASRCSATGAPLELPALHFMCGHSFSARALGDGGQECPICAPELRRVLEIRRNMAATGLQQDRFFTELRESGDGFSVIADHFGRGLMNLTPTTAAAAAAAAGSKGF